MKVSVEPEVIGVRLLTTNLDEWLQQIIGKTLYISLLKRAVF